jgi:type I restriction enzyme S subunit
LKHESEIIGNTGAVFNSINKAQIEAIEIPLPPLPEQQRIVSILDEAFAAIAKAKANAEQNLRNAKEVFESYLQGVFEEKGEGWKEKSLGDIATFRNGMNFTKGSKGERIKIVGVRDFQKNFWVSLEDLEFVTIDGGLNEIDFLKEGDILSVRSNGNPELIGRTLLAGSVAGKVSHSGFTIRIRLNTTDISPIYLCRYLKTQKTRKELVDSGNGVGIKSLNQGSLSSLLIPIPKSLKDQQTIVQKLDTLSTETKKLEAIYQQKINDLEEMKKSILQKAFRGGLNYDSFD